MQNTTKHYFVNHTELLVLNYTSIGSMIMIWSRFIHSLTHLSCRSCLDIICVPCD